VLRSTKISSLTVVRNKKEDELWAFYEKDKVESIESLQEKLKNNDFNDFHIVTFMCGDLFVIQSLDFLKSSAVPRFLLQTSTDLSYQAFHFGIKCIITTLSFNRIQTLDKLSLFS
jgi:hypothetical protein